MDLRFEGAAANEFMRTQKMIMVLMYQRFIGIIPSKKFLTLDKVEGVSIREQEN